MTSKQPATIWTSGLKVVRPLTARPGTHRYTIARHLIFFAHQEDGITVIRILHQRMDVEQ